ncbi:YMGG-like glycine zipper-containing protein [Hymenobacter sp. BT175]|uniref:glycine zipper domain-containing protein n=1 Tax=Hymenobacter translucens TaxID=2886507 RepID=UPI001D0E67AA|nr:glycine zipper domain-containing protein [Hymenobacter translucens]MCC2547612.1 YMGG-like glycine zipper-containing protein [Hymenobacter translucens]
MKTYKLFAATLLAAFFLNTSVAEAQTAPKKTWSRKAKGTAAGAGVGAATGAVVGGGKGAVVGGVVGAAAGGVLGRRRDKKKDPARHAEYSSQKAKD